jgi:nitrate/TMAO reductase-like tetraheme cytochrome c subunit
LLLTGVLVAAVGWGSFSAFLDYSNSLGFCTSCHEMREFVYEEYRQSAHYQNPAGARAICSDCHVPKALGPKLWKKVVATFNEVPKHLLGTIDTREKFEARRLTLAEHVWADMKANDSRACRGCHSDEAMKLEAQKPRAKGQHEDALASGETCIDCHEGVAHKLPERPEQEQPEQEEFEL